MLGPICNSLVEFRGSPSFGGLLGPHSALNKTDRSLAVLQVRCHLSEFPGRWVSACIPQTPDSEGSYMAFLGFSHMLQTQ